MPKSNKETTETCDNGCPELAGEIVAAVLEQHWQDHRKEAIHANTRGLNTKAKFHIEVADLLSELFLQVVGRRPQDWQ